MPVSNLSFLSKLITLHYRRQPLDVREPTKADHGQDGVAVGRQGWVRNVKARDRDDTETLASPAETRPRRDVTISRRNRDETFVALDT